MNATYKLVVKETGSKAGKYHYRVVDESGKVISDRDSNRVYEACTVDGRFYFGRRDLVFKGEHGRAIKVWESRELTEGVKAKIEALKTIAYK